MEADLSLLEARLGYCFAAKELLLRALTHPSYGHESGQDGDVDYQRLEFVGDAVLGMLLAELLYSRFPELPEGDLSRCRSHLADQESLAVIARKCGIGDFIRLGRGEVQTGGRGKDSILADVLEALIAAIYLDGGLIAARTAVLALFGDLLAAPAAQLKGGDAKSRLQELLSARHLPAPEYRLIDESGPPHDRNFTFQVLLAAEVLGSGSGRSKKIAQQAAATAALAILEDSRALSA